MIRRLYTLLIFILFVTGVSTRCDAQLFANSWINYSQSYYRVRVWQDGMYRVNYSVLQTAGLPLSNIKGNTFHIYYRGLEVPLYVTTASTLGSSDYIEFYGLKNDGGADAPVYDSLQWQANDKLSLFNDTSAYYLTWSTAANTNQYTNTNNNISNPPTPENYCWYTALNVYGYNSLGVKSSYNYIQGAPAIPGQEIWDSNFSNGEGFADFTFNKTSMNYTLYTPYPYVNGQPAELKTEWLGKFPTYHYMQISIGNSLLAVSPDTGFFSARYDGFLPNNNLLVGNSSVANSTDITYNTSYNPNPIVTVDYNAISYVMLTYPRQFNFDNTSTFPFSLNASATNQYVVVTNFNAQGTTPVLYDMTNKLRLQAVVSNDTFKFLLPPSASERKMVMVANTTTAITPITTITPLTFVNYTQAANQGNFIIIYNNFFSDSAGVNYISELQQVKNNNGFQSVAIDINQLYDQFGYGNFLSPLCIRNFTDYITSKWTAVQGQKYIMLVGKAIEFESFDNNPPYQAICYVPTWGYPGSDILLTAQPNNPVPRIPIGRLSILYRSEFANYIDKLNGYYATLAQPQSIANKLWTKRVIHLAGGEDASDQAMFQYILNAYAVDVDDSVYFGGSTTLFSKNSSAPISIAQSSLMDSLINTGVSLITFFGHASYQSLDFNLNNPYNYSNKGKYPLILTNGCLVGNLFLDGEGLSDEFTFAHECGSIGFLAPSSFSVSNSLQSYTNAFYHYYTKAAYNSSVGVLIQKAVQNVWTTLGDVVDKTCAEQMLYEGDPSVLLGTHPKPDYDIEPQSVYFTPGVVSAGIDTFKINVIVSNLGEAVDDSFYINITRIMPDGTQSIVAHNWVKSPYYIDTFSYKVGNNYLTGLGLNQFNIVVDATNKIDEIAKWNNSLTVSLVIQADDILPIYPYEFSIVNTKQLPLILKASTVDPFLKSGHYIFQIDTTENFNSPLLKTQHITMNGGVINWTPGITPRDSIVYYWRTSIDTIGGQKYNWHVTSFIYLAASSPGWNQSHYFQYTEDTYANVQLQTNRKFSFVNDVKNIGVYDGLTNYVGGPLSQDQPSYYIDNVRMANWTCGLGVNWMFAVIDSATGLQWISYTTNSVTGSYGDFQCYANPFNDFFYGPSNYTSLISFINIIPKGDYVMAMSINSPGYNTLPPSLLSAFHTIGARKIDTISGQVPYVLFSKKGETTYPVYEIVGKNINSIIDTTFKITGKWSKGYIESTEIGPAANWQSLHWKVKKKDPTGSIQMQVIGIKNDGTQTILINNVLASDTSLAGINVNTYPYLQLRINYTDSITRIPPQLAYLRINYTAEPELAIDPNAYYSLKDTANEYGALNLSYAVANVSEFKMTHVEVKYTITDASNAQHIVYNYLDSVKAFDTIHAKLNYPLNLTNYIGVNKMVIEINPYDNNHKQEQYHFNNLATLNFVVTKNAINPLLDVTFDGIHILDGDIVSAKPEIDLTLKSTDKNLALNQPSLFKINYLYPDGSTHNVVFDGVTNEFIPADSTKLSQNNTAKAILKPILSMDGTYHINAQGYDRSGNAAGNYSYTVSFEVINKPMISNVLNYPNPFTTHTQFVFTLTGSSIPQFMKIQIMTITGKVVKEISQDELGPIHVGTNITEYAWDGTDQYGSRLANGLYIYRVVTRLNNANLAEYQTNTDQYFKDGFGKMYMAK